MVLAKFIHIGFTVLYEASRSVTVTTLDGIAKRFKVICIAFAFFF
jgi:hypothetical protein